MVGLEIIVKYYILKVYRLRNEAAVWFSRFFTANDFSTFEGI